VLRIVDVVAPPRMGPNFRWLVASSWVSNLGDGIALAAGPLLVASQTGDAFLVALATLLQRLPWMLFGLYAGVVADRFDRRRVVVLVNSIRSVILMILAATILTDVVSVWVVLAAMFLLGTAETFADVTTQTLLPMVVDRVDLGVGNARLMFGNITINRLAGPPIGAILFAAGMVLPFATQAICVALGALLVSQMRVPVTEHVRSGHRVRREIRDGLRWVWEHPAIRTLTITIVAFNITFGAVWSILVLYVTERLGLGPVGFGLITSVGAIGGIVGASSYGWLERRLGMANIMRAGLLIETLFHLSLALTTSVAVAVPVFFVFGIHEAAWGTTSATIRQRVVPMEFQGRVASVYMVGVFGSLVVGAALGGVLAGVWGITAPFWFGFVGSAVILTLIWGQLANIASAE
jgi:MFS family permease